MNIHQPVALGVLPLTGVQLIETSAGTGKTWTLSGIFLPLVVRRANQSGWAAERQQAAAALKHPDTLRAALTERLGRRAFDKLLGSPKRFRIMARDEDLPAHLPPKGTCGGCTTPDTPRAWRTPWGT